MIGVADVETSMMKHGEAPRCKFWGLATEELAYSRFPTTRKLWEYMARLPGKHVIYVHHDYDMIQAHVDGLPLTIQQVRGGRILSATGPDNIEWRNSYALFPAPLKEILETCGFEKPDLDHLAARNKADTTDALAAFFRLSEKYETCWGVRPLGGRYLTAASVAFAAAEIVAGKLPVWLQDRETYRGGRTEVFRVGQCGEADLYDINSSYPASILDAPESDSLLYCKVDVRTEGPTPFFALTESRGKLLFPAGRFETAVWASSYERYLAPHGGIAAVKVGRKVTQDFGWLSRLKPLIARAYAERRKAKAAGDSVLAWCAKTGLNSIYGRLGMRGARECVFYSKQVACGDEVAWYDLPDGFKVSFRTVPTKPRANYLFASYITCNARARLYDALRRSESPFYCDTDSVYVPKGSPFPMKQGAGLGEWKPESTARLTVRSLKDYRFGNEWKRKGGSGGYTWTIRRALDGAGVREGTKTRRSEYDKRVVQGDGSTLPIALDTW